MSAAEQWEPTLETTVRRVTTVATLTDAFAFVMDSLDRLGGDPQRVTVSRFYSWDAEMDGPEWSGFEVLVESMTKEAL